MMCFVSRAAVSARKIAVAFALLLSVSAFPAETSRSAQLDSLLKALDSLPEDSTRLKQTYIAIQENLNHYWTLELINYAIAQAERQHHLVWAMAFQGCRVRWCHRMRDWERMDEFLMIQRAKAIKHEEYGNYFSQIGQSAIVMAMVGRFEQSWRYIEQMERDMSNAGKETLERYEIYSYLVKADYYKYRGNEAKRLALLLAAWDNHVQTNTIQRISLHIELIDVFGKMGQYKQAIAHADSVLLLYDTYSPERKALPQSRGNISDANLRKVDIYHKLGNFPKMKECLDTAMVYMDTTHPESMGSISYWWAKYYFGVNDYARSLEFMDKAVAVRREHGQVNGALEAEMEKAHLLIAMGRYDDALDICIPTLPRLDSVRTVKIREQHEYLHELEEILAQRERSDNMDAWKTTVVEIAAMVLFCVVLLVLFYVLSMRGKLKRNHHITEERLREANDADKEKELFLRNMTQLIGQPLKEVVNSAKRLADDTTLSGDEQQELVNRNKVEVGHLLELVNNVLDLSRLEAGMMKYQTSEVDIIQALNNFVGNYNMRNMNTPVRLAYDVEEFRMDIEPTRFGKIPESLFAVPFSRRDEEVPEHRTIKVEPTDDGCLRIRFSGSLYADESKLTEAERMVNKINRFFLRDFQSTYIITPDFDIVVTLKSDKQIAIPSYPPPN